MIVLYLICEHYFNVLFDSLFSYICPEKLYYSMSKKQKFQLLALLVIILISFLFIKSHKSNEDSSVENTQKSSPNTTG